MTKDEQIKALTERLESCFRVIDEATDVLKEWCDLQPDLCNAFSELLGELAPTEELLKKLKP